ncbi:hypothetical protein [Rhodopila sp.]|uniref:hypothetical protein n=1 Tax=Rhodopila sp. TaxID=2480087 RepID=UPI003D0A96A3
MDDMPFMAIGTDELDAYIGEKAICPNCRQMHDVQYADEVRDGKTYPSKLLGFVKCGENAYVVAIDGRALS